MWLNMRGILPEWQKFVLRRGQSPKDLVTVLEDKFSIGAYDEIRDPVTLQPVAVSVKIMGSSPYRREVNTSRYRGW
jgi:hypothetical protein